MKGRCFCGAVRYQLNSKPQAAYYCHCRDCQYLAGAPFHVLCVVESGSIELISGDLSAYQHGAQDGSGMTREFCTRCGTPLFITSTRWDDIQMLTVNTLDQAEAVEPSFEIWTTSKLSWANIPTEIDSFPYGSLDGNTEPGA